MQNYLFNPSLDFQLSGEDYNSPSESCILSHLSDDSHCAALVCFLKIGPSPDWLASYTDGCEKSCEGRPGYTRLLIGPVCVCVCTRVELH